MRKFKRILAAAVSAVMTASVMSASAFAEETETPQGGHVVTGMYDNGVLLDYDIYLSNDEFKQLSGTDYKLRYGDVITTNCNELIVTLPGQFCIKEDTYAKYIGTVTEVYKDSITELTVTKKETDSSYFELQDSSGNIYQWSTYLPYTSSFFGDKCAYDIDPHDVNIGDVLSCAVTENAFGKEVVLMPVSVVSKTDNPETPSDDTTVQIKFKSGDANHDGKVNVRDCACIATAVATKTTDSLPASADYNEDGYKNIRDASAIARYLEKKTHIILV